LYARSAIIGFHVKYSVVKFYSILEEMEGGRPHLFPTSTGHPGTNAATGGRVCTL